jgi:hypothetical protein
MKIKIFGGSLINLALAECLYKNNKEFSWYTLGEKVGGHFSGINIQGNFVDLGMVLLEFGSSSIKEFDGVGDIKAFQALVKFFDRYDTEPASIKVKFKSSIHPDYIISDNCKLIWEQNYPSNSTMVCPSQKWQLDYFDSTTYHEYCRTAYPEFYSELLERFANKISYGGHEKMSCRYHRSAWLPLYYPNTVSGQNNCIKNYPFRKFSGRSVADVVNEKFSFLKANTNSIIDEQVRDLDDLIDKNDKGQNFISCELKKLDTAYTDLLNHCTYQTKINVAIFSFDNHEMLGFDCVNEIDDAEIYRIFFQSTSRGKGHIVVEGIGTFENDTSWPVRAKSFLESNFNLDEIVAEFSRSCINGAKLPLPRSEPVLNHIKNSINTKFGGGNCFNYGVQDGFQALSMNRQISHAINEWWSLV